MNLGPKDLLYNVVLHITNLASWLAFNVICVTFQESEPVSLSIENDT